MRKRLARTSALLVILSAVWSEAPGSAAAPPVAASVASPASVTLAARRIIAQSVDLVSVFNTGEIRPEVAGAAMAAAGDAGGWGIVGRGFGVGMTQVTRNGAIVQQATPGWYFPVSVTALPVEGIAASMGAAVSTPVGNGQVVMGETSASLSGAQAGDVVHLLGFDGSVQQFVIGRVAPDAEVGGTEIVMSTAQADSLGATISTRVLIAGHFDRALLDTALSARGLTGDPKVRIRRSWDAFDPDLTLGLALTKKSLGQFDYIVGANDSVSVDADWMAAFIPSREPYPTGIRAACNNAIKADLNAALAEVESSGLGGAIDASNANTFGGCFGPRFARIVGTQLGSLSRHTWAQALDTNTTSNCQGCVPQMDCRVVRIFRKHNFAWGGNFLLPDGMHFEWVGEPRNTQQYPSRYCPNLVNGAIQSMVLQGDSRSTLFAGDGWALTGD
jgi:hypothetical protein